MLEVGDLRLDPATRQVWRGETEIELSAKEFALLEAFMRRPGQVLSRFQLLEHAWDYDYENRSNVVDVYVRYLREKIDRPVRRRVDRDRARRGLPAAPRTAGIEPAADPAAAHARLRRRDGGRARRAGLFVYLRFGSDLDDTPSTRAALAGRRRVGAARQRRLGSLAGRHAHRDRG